MISGRLLDSLSLSLSLSLSQKKKKKTKLELLEKHFQIHEGIFTPLNFTEFFTLFHNRYNNMSQLALDILLRQSSMDDGT